jgi:Rrf2 family protein
LHFTSKEEYGLRAVIYLAERESPRPIQVREIAASEDIPEQFLEQVLAALRRSGIIRSIRGAAGGYELAKAARHIKAGDVIRALSGPIAPIPCMEEGSQVSCAHTDKCVVVSLWQRIQAAVSDIVDTTTIQDMVDQKTQNEEGTFLAMNI